MVMQCNIIFYTVVNNNYFHFIFVHFIYEDMKNEIRT